MATSRDLLPSWLLRHDRHSTTTSSDDEKSSSSPSSSSSLAPPSHITMVPWDDGFTPSGCNGKPGKIVRDQLRSTPSAFHVVDRAVSRETADLLYESAVKAKVWGVYVPTAELSLSNQSQASIASSDAADDAIANEADKDKEESYRRSLAKRAVQELLVEKASSVISSSDWASTHGVAVWVIASDCDDETEYHLDYAEMVRYETNVIVPPLYGATLHVSPLRNSVVSSSSNTPDADPDNQEQDDDDDDDDVSIFEGGGFHVNVNGLEHYKQYGYKTRLAQKLTTDALEAVSASESGWQHVSYSYRRGIICDGEFPHFSGRVRSLPAKEVTRVSGQLPVKRVVVGFNLFPPEIGAFVQKFPEHSNAFNKYIKLSQAAVKKTSGGSTTNGTAGTGAGAQQNWSLESLKKNPKQAAFLKFLAKKMKEKNIDMAALTRGVGGSGPDAGVVAGPVNTAPVAAVQASTTAS